jgi:hypothetical protein
LTDQARQALFISHASPEDNAFTLWLGAKLAALGYEVFADVLRLKGGDDWERILEYAIREKAAKFLLVATPHGVQKQGVRNEITIATQTAKRIKEDAFIVPCASLPTMPRCKSLMRSILISRKAGPVASVIFFPFCRKRR